MKFKKINQFRVSGNKVEIFRINLQFYYKTYLIIANYHQTPKNNQYFFSSFSESDLICQRFGYSSKMIYYSIELLQQTGTKFSNKLSYIFGYPLQYYIQKSFHFLNLVSFFLLRDPVYTKLTIIFSSMLANYSNYDIMNEQTNNTYYFLYNATLQNCSMNKKNKTDILLNLLFMKQNKKILESSDLDTYLKILKNVIKCSMNLIVRETVLTTSFILQFYYDNYSLILL